MLSETIKDMDKETELKDNKINCLDVKTEILDEPIIQQLKQLYLKEILDRTVKKERN